MLKRQRLVAAFIASAVFGSVFIGERNASASGYSTSFQTVSLVCAGKGTGGNPAGALDGYFTLTSIATLGTCGTLNGSVIFRTKDADKNVLATVTAAFLSGKKIQAWIDDGPTSGNKDAAGYCYIQNVIMQ